MTTSVFGTNGPDFQLLMTCTQVSKFLAYASAHPESMNNNPPDRSLVHDWAIETSKVVEACAKFTYEILKMKQALGEHPSHQEFVDYLYVPTGGLFGVANQVESEADVEALLQKDHIQALIERTFTIFWTMIYPNLPDPEGNTDTLEQILAKRTAMAGMPQEDEPEGHFEA